MKKVDYSGKAFHSFLLLLRLPPSGVRVRVCLSYLHSLGVVQGLVAGVFAPKRKFHPGQVASLRRTYHHPYHRIASIMQCDYNQDSVIPFDH